MWSSVAITFLHLQRARKFFFFVRYLLWLFLTLYSSFWEDPVTSFCICSFWNVSLRIYIPLHLLPSSSPSSISLICRISPQTSLESLRVDFKLEERRPVWVSGMCWFPEPESCPNSEQMKNTLYDSLSFPTAPTRWTFQLKPSAAMGLLCSPCEQGLKIPAWFVQLRTHPCRNEESQLLLLCIHSSF